MSISESTSGQRVGEGGEKGYDFAADERERIRFSQELERVLATGSPPPQWLTPSGNAARPRLVASFITINVYWNPASSLIAGLIRKLAD